MLLLGSTFCCHVTLLFKMLGYFSNMVFSDIGIGLVKEQLKTTSIQYFKINFTKACGKNCIHSQKRWYIVISVQLTP